MTEETILYLLRRWTPLAVEIPASMQDRSAWIGVYPLNPEWPETRELLNQRGILMHAREPMYRVRRFEVERALIDADVWLCETDLRDKRDAIAIGDEDLRLKLAEYGVRLDQLLQHFKTDYPI
jgi:hypothetical protein